MLTSQSNTHYKVLVLGESKTGKTSIVKRFNNNEFRQEHIPTRGVDFSIKNVELSNPTTESEPNSIQLFFWDVAGSEINNGKMTKVYYKQADAAIIVFDLSTDKSFSSITTWLNDLRSNSEKNIPVFVFGNKSDLTHYDVDPLVEYCEQNGITGCWSLTSALENTSITESVRAVADILVSRNASSNTLVTMD